MKKKFFNNCSIKFLLLITLLSILLGCQNKSSLKELNITHVKAPLNVPTIVEYKEDSFNKAFSSEGIKVNFVNLTTGPQQLQGIASGNVDIAHGVGAMSVILAASNDMPLVILNAYSRSPKSFMLISNKKENSSLKGYKIAGPKGTILHQLLLNILEKQGVLPSEIEFVNMGLQEASAALENGSVDAALLAGVIATNKLNEGKTLVSTGEGLIDALVVSVTTEKFLKNNPEVIKKFLKVHNETLDFINKNPETALQYVSEELMISLDEAKSQFLKYDFSSQITDKDMIEIEKTQEFLLKSGLQTKKIDLKKLIYSK
ncbi:MAG: ABC transporter substrate-binding protein [Fusobacteriaceae bacterium]